MSLPIIRKISEKDTMQDRGEDAYFKVGEDALNVCKYYLKGKEPKTILDFPSGYGRALRWFKAQWPEAKIYAIETDQEALSFCESTFEATKIAAVPDLEMELPKNVDLIFTGSLLTHFDEWQWDKYLEICVDALSPDGILVFTTHGRVAACQVRDNHKFYGDTIDGKKLLSTYLEKGFAYQPYSPDYPEFGVSLSAPSWVMAKIEKLSYGKIVAYQEQGWGQDVVVLTKNSWKLTQ